MSHTFKIYRARGFYLPTGRESWITTVWRRTKQEALEDAEMFGHNHKDIKIVEKERYTEKVG